MSKKAIKKPFEDPAIRAKAHAAAKGKPRPNRKSKAKLVEEVKKEVIREELIREGYLKAVQEHMPKVMKAHFAVASKKNASATQERKLLFQSVGLQKDEGNKAVESMGQIIAELMKS